MPRTPAALRNPKSSGPRLSRKFCPRSPGWDAATQTEFVYRQIQIGRTISLMPGVAPTLRWLVDKRLVLGIASNAQAYTLRELETMLKTGGLSSKVFDAELAYWSYQNGFSKPDPHGYQMIRIRLEARGISPMQTLMVGDRLDNDVAPRAVARISDLAFEVGESRRNNPATGRSYASFSCVQFSNRMDLFGRRPGRAAQALRPFLLFRAPPIPTSNTTAEAE
jgi:hypothetical protein